MSDLAWRDGNAKDLEAVAQNALVIWVGAVIVAVPASTKDNKRSKASRSLCLEHLPLT